MLQAIINHFDAPHHAKLDQALANVAESGWLVASDNRYRFTAEIELYTADGGSFSVKAKLSDAADAVLSVLRLQATIETLN